MASIHQVANGYTLFLAPFLLYSLSKMPLQSPKPQTQPPAAIQLPLRPSHLLDGLFHITAPSLVLPILASH